MVKWSLLHQATSPGSKPTPGWLFHAICSDVRSNPGDCPDVAEFLMQCVCNDQLSTQLKAVLTIKHLAAEDVTFQHYMQVCTGALAILQDIAAPPIVPQSRNLETLEVKTVRDASQTALDAIATPHTVEKQTESADLKTRIQGFGNYAPPPEVALAKPDGFTGHVAGFVGDSIGDMVDDFRDKGAVGALKDATVDALDLVLDGVDAVWGWVVGKDVDMATRICQPSIGLTPRPIARTPLHAVASGATVSAPAVGRTSAVANMYAAAFGHGVVGANNPIMISDPSKVPPVDTSNGSSSNGSSNSTGEAFTAAEAVKEAVVPEGRLELSQTVGLLAIHDPTDHACEWTGDNLCGLEFSSAALTANKNDNTDDLLLMDNLTTHVTEKAVESKGPSEGQAKIGSVRRTSPTDKGEGALEAAPDLLSDDARLSPEGTDDMLQTEHMPCESRRFSADML